MKFSPVTLIIALVVVGLLFYFVPYFIAFYILCGLYDVLRNKALDFSKIYQYYLGNGTFTWLLSPFNLLMDILSLPYINKGIYKISDLPKGHQDEIQRLIAATVKHDLVTQLEPRTKDQPRTMIFWKWYGENVDTFVNVPEFHENYKYVRTIGCSIFNRRESTSRHFGPFRATLRFLYNINTMEDNTAYIEVGDVKHYWKDEKVFIFDDTLLHQSFNESDKSRYCLFVDIIRPSPIPQIHGFVVTIIRYLLRGVNSVFYKNWKVLKN